MTLVSGVVTGDFEQFVVVQCDGLVEWQNGDERGCQSVRRLVDQLGDRCVEFFWTGVEVLEDLCLVQCAFRRQRRLFGLGESVGDLVSQLRD